MARIGTAYKFMILTVAMNPWGRCKQSTLATVMPMQHQCNQRDLQTALMTLLVLTDPMLLVLTDLMDRWGGCAS
jgi:hypothetical protein